MINFKLFAAAAVLSTVMIAPTMAQQVYYRSHDGYRERGPIGIAAGVAGLAVGTAATIATAPLRNSYAYGDGHRYDDGYGYDEAYARRNGFVCQPGTLFRGEDGRPHLCQ